MKMLRFIFIGVFCMFAVNALAEPVRVIFDTDMADDCDDTGSLAVLHALADLGECEILAIATSRKDQTGASAAAVDAINHWYGRPGIPIGTDKEGGATSSSPNSSYAEALRDDFPNDAKADCDMPDALDVYREALAGAPNNSVVICCVGALSNLEDLLRNERPLVEKKVKQLVIMGAQFPDSRVLRPETNIRVDIPAAKYVIDNWPGEILFSGFEVGVTIHAGSALQSVPLGNPVRRAFELRLFRGKPSIEKGKPAYDQTAVLLAVRGTQERYWDVVSGGRVEVAAEDGHTRWVEDPQGKQAWVKIKGGSLALTELIDRLMAAPPKKVCLSKPENFQRLENLISPLKADQWSWASTLDYRVMKGGAQAGAKAFTDRPYRFEKLPAHLTGADYVMSRMSDKASDPSAPLLKLNLSRPATVVIAYDRRCTQRPDWLSGWTDIGESLIIPKCAAFRLFKKEVGAGELILNGNRAPNTGAMYGIFIRSDEFSVESLQRCSGRPQPGADLVDIPVYQAKPSFNEYITPEMERAVEKVLVQMTVDEKLTMLSGDVTARGPARRGSAYVDRVGIDTMIFFNGPRGYGIRGGGGTQFPCGVGQAASFKPELPELIAGTVARELLSCGWQVLEAPSMNIIRDPLNGRNFEYFTEDPYLNARLTALFVHGVQRAGAVATAKHLIANNKETNRGQVDAVMDERTLREIYLPAFKAACDAGVLSLMTGANRFNGPHASDNPALINILKREWGWSGFLYTDWNGAQTTVEAFDAGLDLSMPGKPDGAFGFENLKRAYQAGLMDDQALDDKVRRVLRGCYFAGKLKGSPTHPAVVVDYPDHYKKAYEAAVDCMTLVKNEQQALPIRDDDRKIAVIGPMADKHFTDESGGSSGVWNAPYDISAIEGLKKRFGEDRLTYVPFSMDDVYGLLRAPYVFHLDAAGKRCEGFAARYSGTDVNTLKKTVIERAEEAVAFNWEMAGPDRDVLSPDAFTAEWSGLLVPPEDGSYTLKITGTQRVYLSLDNEIVLNKHSIQNSREASLDLVAGQEYKLRLRFEKRGPGDGFIRFSWIRPDQQKQVVDSLERSVQAAAGADVALVLIGLDHNTESEGMDRHTLRLPEYHDQLVERVRAANPRTVVVAYCGTPIAMDPWFESVPAIVLPWFPGIENGNALASVLSGDRDFGGRLPITFPKTYEDSPAHPSRQKDDKFDVIRHNEGIFVGYRWFDHEGIEPLIPFGHGLSYAEFEYSNLQVNADRLPVRVEVDVTNISDRDGIEVVQLYVADPESRLPRPVRELKEFKSIELAAGETRTVRFDLSRDSFSYYDPQASGWVLEPGQFVIEIGRSSRAIVLNQPIELTSE